MTDQSTFEATLERRLIARVARADRPFDAAAIARTAIVAAPPRTARLGGSIALRPAIGWLVVLGLLVLVAAVAIAGVLALPRLDPTLLAVGGSDGLRIQAIDGRDARHIGDGPYFQPRWSPDGEYVAVTALTDEDANHLHVYRADGTLVMDQTGVYGELEWSPARYDLLVQDVATSALNVISVEAGAVRAVLQPNARLPSTFSWAPDGSRIVVAALPAEGGALVPAWILDPTGLEPPVRFGTTDALGLHGPRWSPDGLRIAAIERCPNGDCIRIRDAASGQRRAEVNSLASPSGLAWHQTGHGWPSIPAATSSSPAPTSSR